MFDGDSLGSSLNEDKWAKIKEFKNFILYRNNANYVDLPWLKD